MIARKGTLRLWCGGSSGWGFVVVAAAATHQRDARAQPTGPNALFIYLS